MFQMLNLAYISRSGDFEIFLITLKLYLLNYVLKLTYIFYFPKLNRIDI